MILAIHSFEWFIIAAPFLVVFLLFVRILWNIGTRFGKRRGRK